MYALDNHPGLAAVRGAGLTGRDRSGTPPTWRGEVDVLWSRFTALGVRAGPGPGPAGARSRPGDEELAELTALLRARWSRSARTAWSSTMRRRAPSGGAADGARRAAGDRLRRRHRPVVRSLGEAGSALAVAVRAAKRGAGPATGGRRRAWAGRGPDAALNRLDERLADATGGVRRSAGGGAGGPAPARWHPAARAGR